MAPGGLHIMLTDLKQPLRAGDKLRATLLFRESPPLRLTIPVVSREVLEAAHGQH
jgi:copper(I)-binding protein